MRTPVALTFSCSLFACFIGGCGWGNSKAGQSVSVTSDPAQKNAVAAGPTSDRLTDGVPSLADSEVTRSRTMLRALASSDYRDWDLQDIAVDSLARIGKAAIPALVEALHGPDAKLREGAARAIARMGADAAETVPDLISALGDQDEQVRKSAARALGQIGPAASSAVPALIEELKRDPQRPDSPLATPRKTPE